jgi:small subunit ribosomal protein S20
VTFLANNASAKKRIRQNEKARMRNKSVRTEIRNYIKKLHPEKASAVPSNAQDLLQLIVSKLDKAVSKGVYHKNTAARYKSRLAHHVKKIS